MCVLTACDKDVINSNTGERSVPDRFLSNNVLFADIENFSALNQTKSSDFYTFPQLLFSVDYSQQQIVEYECVKQIIAPLRNVASENSTVYVSDVVDDNELGHYSSYIYVYYCQYYYKKSDVVTESVITLIPDKSNLNFPIDVIDLSDYSGIAIISNIDGSFKRVLIFKEGIYREAQFVSADTQDSSAIMHYFIIKSSIITRANDELDGGCLDGSFCISDRNENYRHMYENVDDEVDDSTNMDDYGCGGGGGGTSSSSNGNSNIPEPYKQTWNKLSNAEKEFILDHPSVAIDFYNNANQASALSRQLYGTSSLIQSDGVGDAFRHIYWSALNAFDHGYDLAYQYGCAHEDEENQTEKSRQWDIYNNNLGYELGQRARQSGWDESVLSLKVQDIVNYGDAKYNK